jgi:hypothetical protein
MNRDARGARGDPTDGRARILPSTRSLTVRRRMEKEAESQVILLHEAWRRRPVGPLYASNSAGGQPTWRTTIPIPLEGKQLHPFYTACLSWQPTPACDHFPAEADRAFFPPG